LGHIKNGETVIGGNFVCDRCDERVIKLVINPEERDKKEQELRSSIHNTIDLLDFEQLKKARKLLNIK
jgi:hypothetical protein